MRTMTWDVSGEQWRSLVRAMQLRFFKWDAYVDGVLRLIPESIVLTPEEHAEIVTLSECLAAALGRIEQTVRRDTRLVESLGISRRVARLISQERARPLQLARYDLFPTPEGGWAVSEFNEDVPGGFNEVVAAPKLLGELHPGGQFPGDFDGSLLAAIPAEGTVALMYATGYAEDLQHMLVLQQLLAGRQQRSILCAPDHLEFRRGQTLIQDEPVSCVVRFYPGEWFDRLPNRHAWQRALPELYMLNPLARLIRQSKRLFAAWQQEGVASTADRVLLNTVAPRTEFFSADRVPQLRADSRPWVLKQSFGRMGDTVVMGSLATPPEWNAALAKAPKQPEQYIIQERFDVRPLEFSCGPLYPAIGPYLINGRFAGYYSRVAPQPFLTHQAYYVPTVVQAE